ncbi:MAG: DUF4097 family beta strand repeat protein [Candidatus Krumholzibacteria bacterium]|nr:DUF4097 family beta strand repeat protein [Candidatus Krumholzibacteria bacterium]
MKRISIIIIVFSVLCIAIGTTEAREIKKDYSETFEVSRGDGLRLKSGDGDVTIRKWDRDEIEIEVHYYADFKLLGSGKRDFAVEFKKKNNFVTVIGKEKSTGTIGFQIFHVREYSYTISAPDYIALDITGDDGEIDIEGWREDIEITADDGEITLVDIKAKRVRIRFEDGDLNIEDLEGRLDITCDDARLDLYRCRVPECLIRAEDSDINIRNSGGAFDIRGDDGNIDLFRLEVSTLNVQTSDGDIDIELLKTDALDLDVRTDDGDICVSIQEGVSAVFSIDVEDGRIRADLSTANDVRKGKNWMSGKLGSGKGRIRIRTNDGRVDIREIR